MSLTRLCDACDRPIDTTVFFDVHLQTKDPSGPEVQDPIAQAYGDFCIDCVRSGKAIEKLQARIRGRKKAPV